MSSFSYIEYLHNFRLNCLLCVLTNMLTGFFLQKSWLLTAMAHKLWRKTLAYIHCFAMPLPLRTVGKIYKKTFHVFSERSELFSISKKPYFLARKFKILNFLGRNSPSCKDDFLLILPTVHCCLKHTSREHIFTTLVSCFYSRAAMKAAGITALLYVYVLYCIEEMECCLQNN